MAKTKSQALLPMDETKLAVLGQRLMEQIQSARDGMQDMLRTMEKQRNLYESKLQPKSKPWDGCSNVNVPVIQAHVDTIHAHLNDTICGVDPIVLVNPPPSDTRPGIKQLGARIEQYLQDVLTKSMGFGDAYDEVGLESLLAPVAVAKLPWREDYRVVKRIGLDVQTGEYGPQDTKQAKHKGPRMELVNLQNFVIYPLSAQDVESAMLIGDRFRLSADEIRRRVSQGYFDKDAAERVLTDLDTETTQIVDNGEDDERNREGIDGTDAETAAFWEVITGYDVNGDGLNEDCVFIVDEKNANVVRAKPFPYFHGRRYYIPFRTHLRPRRFFGISLPHKLEHMNREINAIHNQRTDAITLGLSKSFLRRKGSMTTINDLQVYPGAVNDVDSTDDVKELPLDVSLPGVDVEQGDREYAERASGVNDISAGKGMTGQKTLGELQMTQGAGGIRFGDMVRRQQIGVAEVARQVLGLCYQFAPDEELASYGIQREDLAIEWDVNPHGNTGTANKMQQRQEAQMLYDKLLMNPLVQPDPLRVYAITRDLLIAFGKTDPESYIGSEEELQQKIQQQQQMAQQQQQQMEMEQQQAQEAEIRGMMGGLAGGEPGAGGVMGGPGGPMGPGAGVPPPGAGGPPGPFVPAGPDAGP